MTKVGKRHTRSTRNDHEAGPSHAAAPAHPNPSHTHPIPPNPIPAQPQGPAQGAPAPVVANPNASTAQGATPVANPTHTHPIAPAQAAAAAPSNPGAVPIANAAQVVQSHPIPDEDVTMEEYNPQSPGLDEVPSLDPETQQILAEVFGPQSPQPQANAQPQTVATLVQEQSNQIRLSTQLANNPNEPSAARHQELIEIAAIAGQEGPAPTYAQVAAIGGPEAPVPQTQTIANQPTAAGNQPITNPGSGRNE